MTNMTEEFVIPRKEVLSREALANVIENQQNEIESLRTQLSKPQSQTVADALEQSSAVLPNGKICTNVYEAYAIGLEQAAKECEEWAQAVEKVGTHKHVEGEIFAYKNAACAIRALIQTER